MLKRILLTLVTATVLSQIAPVSGQINLQMFFVHEAEPGQQSHAYSWRWLGQNGFNVTSPGGTTDVGGFDTLEQFQNDVVGRWNVIFVNNQVEVTFEISEFAAGTFSQFELVSPMAGDIFFSGEDIQTVVSPADAQSSGLNLSGSGGFDINFLGGGAFEAFLSENSQSASISVARTNTDFVDGLITSITGDDEIIQVQQQAFVRTVSNRRQIMIVNNPSLGDINGDGTVDLLDIEPFLAVLAGSKYILDADINLDNVVDLLDVFPFVELITSQ